MERPHYVFERHDTCSINVYGVEHGCRGAQKFDDVNAVDAGIGVHGRAYELESDLAVVKDQSTDPAGTLPHTPDLADFRRFQRLIGDRALESGFGRVEGCLATAAAINGDGPRESGKHEFAVPKEVNMGKNIEGSIDAKGATFQGETQGRDRRARRADLGDSYGGYSNVSGGVESWL